MIKSFSIFSLCSVLFLCLVSMAFPLPVSAADTFAGNVKLIEAIGKSDANIIRAGKKEGVAVKIGDAVFIGDTIKTGANTRVQLALSDNSSIFIAPNSSLQVKEFFINHAQGKRNVVVKADVGKYRFLVEKIFRAIAGGPEKSWKDSKYKIETPTAVAGIKGSDILADVKKDSSRFTVIIGILGVQSALPGVKGEVTVTANQSTTIPKNAPPQTPIKVAPQVIENMKKETTPIKVLQQEKSEAPKGDKEAKGDKDKEAKEAKIKADLADKSKPVQEVLKKNIDKGMSLEDAIAAAVKAGADPATVVYAAIQAGYSAQQVVSAAIKAGAPLAAVVNAALIAGADPKAIVQALVDAGVSPEVAAAAVADATASEAPAFGYTPAETPAPPVTYNPSPPVIGGGGGATPSTETTPPASPTKP